MLNINFLLCWGYRIRQANTILQWHNLPPFCTQHEPAPTCRLWWSLIHTALILYCIYSLVEAALILGARITKTTFTDRAADQRRTSHCHGSMLVFSPNFLGLCKKAFVILEPLFRWPRMYRDRRKVAGVPTNRDWPVGRSGSDHASIHSTRR